MQPETIVTVETDLFEHRTVQPHFINPCCFGEDFAQWLRLKCTELTKAGFKFSEPVQEDYGWGLWANHRGENYWIALSYVGDGPTEHPAQWVVSIMRPGGLIALKSLLRKPDLAAMELLRNTIQKILEAEPAIKILDSAG